jgi:hypothetical protein
MPYQTEWVDPDLAVEHEGLKVYHTYRNNDVDQGCRTYWYTTDPKLGENDDSPYVFDIRDIYAEATEHPIDNDLVESLRALLHRAVDEGRLTFPPLDEQANETS